MFPAEPGIVDIRNSQATTLDNNVEATNVMAANYSSVLAALRSEKPSDEETTAVRQRILRIRSRINKSCGSTGSVKSK